MGLDDLAFHMRVDVMNSYENYCDQVELGGVDGKVIKVSCSVGFGSDDSYERYYEHEDMNDITIMKGYSPLVFMS